MHNVRETAFFGGTTLKSLLKRNVLWGVAAAGMFFGGASPSFAAMLELSSNATWTDLSPLEGYDGVKIAAGRELTLAPAAGTTMCFDKVIAGAGGILKDGAGDLELRGANTFEGVCVIAGTGNVYAYSDSAFGSSVGRTAIYAYRFSGGIYDSGADGANLYLCGITTDEGFDIYTNDKLRYLYSQVGTENTINGSVTLSGSQASAYALSNSILRFRGGVSGEQFRPSTAPGGLISIEEKPLTAGMWNAVEGSGTLILAAPGNSFGYTWQPIILVCDWALNDNARVNWDTGGLHMKIDLNGYANRAGNIGVAREDMNGWVTSTRGKAYLYAAVNSDTVTHLPFRGQVGLYKEGPGTLTIQRNTVNPSDTKGNLCVTNGAVVFDIGASWPKVSDVILSGTGALTLNDSSQLGSPATLDLSDNAVLSLPSGASLTVLSLKLDGTLMSAGTYTAAQLNGHLSDNGATITVPYEPRANWINVFCDASWNDADLASLTAVEGVYVHEGATLTCFNTAPFAFNKPVAGPGTLILDGTAQLDLNTANPEFTGKLHLRGYTETENVMRPVNVNNGGVFGTADKETIVDISRNGSSNTQGIDIFFNTSFATDEFLVFNSNDAPGRIRTAPGTTVTFNGDIAAWGNQVSFMPTDGSSFVFNKSFVGHTVSLSPGADSSLVFNCPCKATLFNSHVMTETSRVVFNATGNAPLGYFFNWAVFGVDFALDGSADPLLGMGYWYNVKFDLRGHPQRVPTINHYASDKLLENCSYVTDTTGAKTFLHVNSTEIGDSRVYFTGSAGLCWENTGAVTLKETTSTSTGNLLVEKGRVKFDTAKWIGGDTVTVKDGAVLELTCADDFAFDHIVIEEGGKLILPSGTLHVCDITVDGRTYPGGTSTAFADHPGSLEGEATVSCDGEYVIHVGGTSADTVETVSVNIPATVQRIIKTGKGTAYVTGVNATSGAEIIVREGVLGVATGADVAVLVKEGLSGITVEEGGTFETGCMDVLNARPLRYATLKLAGRGARKADGSYLGAVRIARRSGTEESGNRHRLFGPIILTGDATIDAADMDCGTTDADQKALNGYTLTKEGYGQLYLGGSFSPGNFVCAKGNIVFFNNPTFEGDETNTFSVEAGSLAFLLCNEAMTPIPHKLIWGAANLNVIHQTARWSGPWDVQSSALLTTGAAAPENGTLQMTGVITAKNGSFALASTQPRLVVTGAEKHEFVGIQNAGRLEFRDGAEVWMNPQDGTANDYAVAKNIGENVAYGLPASLLVSNATLTAPEAHEPSDKSYGAFVLAWVSDYAGELVIEGNSHLVGTLNCGWEGIGAVRQSGGEFVAKDMSGRGGVNYFGIQPSALGTYVLDGGRFESAAQMHAALVGGSVALIRQNGGEFVTGIHGGFNTGNGMISVYQTGGVFTNAADEISFAANADAAGSRAEITVRGAVTRQYHQGTLKLGGDESVLQISDGATLGVGIIDHAVGAARNFYFGSDGGVLKPHQAGEVFAGQLPDRATVYAGGLIVDTDEADGEVTLNVALKKPMGMVVAGITLPTDEAFLLDRNYLGPAKVTISGGSGFGATAVTEYDATTRTLTAVTIASPGCGFIEGDSVTATVEGPFRKQSYACTVTLGDPDLSGGLTKRGAGKLILSGANDYQGVTRVEGGTLAFASGAYPANSEVEITADAVNAARATKTPALVVADFPNGRTVTIDNAEKLMLEDLVTPIRIVTFAGAIPTVVELRLRNSEGNPFVLPKGTELYFSNGAIKIGPRNGLTVRIR